MSASVMVGARKGGDGNLGTDGTFTHFFPKMEMPGLENTWKMRDRRTFPNFLEAIGPPFRSPKLRLPHLCGFQRVPTTIPRVRSHLFTATIIRDPRP